MTAERPRVLHLTLHRKWFEEIRLGIKLVEYRKATPYWNSRLAGKHYDEIRFVNGYGKHRPFMRVECLVIPEKPTREIRTGLKRWCIGLGKILEIGNLPPPQRGRHGEGGE